MRREPAPKFDIPRKEASSNWRKPRVRFDKLITEYNETLKEEMLDHCWNGNPVETFIALKNIDYKAFNRWLKDDDFNAYVVLARGYQYDYWYSLWLKVMGGTLENQTEEVLDEIIRQVKSLEKVVFNDKIGRIIKYEQPTERQEQKEDIDEIRKEMEEVVKNANNQMLKNEHDNPLI